MNIFFGLAFFLIISGVKGDEIDTYDDTQCDDYYMKANKKINNIEQYCFSTNKPCIIKCCGDNEVFNFSVCTNIKEIGILASQVNYSNLIIYTNGTDLNQTNKKLTEDFSIVQNKKFMKSDCIEESLDPEIYILEDGVLTVNYVDYSIIYTVNSLEYCIEYKVEDEKIHLVHRELLQDTSAIEEKMMFNVYGCLISCFFILLMLAVYSVLPNMRKMVDKMLMAYVLSLFFTYILLATRDLVADNTTSFFCKTFSPVMYYTTLSCFFWMHIMSLDIWWTFRGIRKCRDIHRRGELVKFLQYALFAWGTPVLMTIVVVVLDNIDMSQWPGFIEPPFISCLADKLSMYYYFFIPIYIITLANVILFLMTGYNIWLIRHKVLRNPDSRKSKKEGHSYSVYIKLAVIMGVTWLLELYDDENAPVWVSDVINFCNLYMGVAIFFLFVVKKDILIQLQRRFGIKSKYVVDDTETSRSGSTRTWRSSSMKSARTRETTVV